MGLDICLRWIQLSCSPGYSLFHGVRCIAVIDRHATRASLGNFAYFAVGDVTPEVLGAPSPWHGVRR